jgi:plasmid stability protein
MKMMTVRMTPEERERLKAHAKAQGMSANSWARMILLNNLTTNPEPSEEPNGEPSASADPQHSDSQ